MISRSFLVSAFALMMSTIGLSSAMAAGDKLDVVVSILPQEAVVQGVGGDLVSVTMMIPPGMHPNAYEPKPTQMAALEDADLYVAIGLPHEKNWVPQIQATHPDLPILNIRSVVKTRSITGKKDASGNELPDPHIWLAAPQLRKAAIAIRDELTKLDPDHADAFAANTEAWLAKVDKADADAAAKLAPYKGKAFLAFHPAWGYVADQYGLRQIAIEQKGMEPGPKMIAKTIDTARAENIKVIFVQAHFSQKEAETIAKEIGGQVVKLNPLGPDPVGNLTVVADAFVASFK